MKYVAQLNLSRHMAACHVIWAIIVLMALSGCSPDDGDQGLEKQSQELEVVAPTIQEVVTEPGQRFSTMSAPAESHWPYGFDLIEDRVSATVLALGDVQIHENGTLGIRPTPTHYPTGELMPGDWRYETRLDHVGRAGSMKGVTAPRSQELDGSRVTLNYANGLSVYYEHRPNGLKQFIEVSERPEGQGMLRLDFGTTGKVTPRAAADGQSVDVVLDDRVVFSWTDLLVYDARGVKLKARLSVKNAAIIFEVEDADAVYPITVDPLASAPAWTRDGPSTDTNYGNTVASAGDVNGDGFSDILIGDTSFTSTFLRQGRALLFLGAANGPANTATFVVAGDSANENLGTSVANAGDLDGDGCTEIIIGAPGYDQARGRALLYRPFLCNSNDNDVQPSPVWSLIAPEEISWFGRSVGRAGDVNCDGNADVIIGAPLKHKAYVFHGIGANAGYLPDTADWIHESPTADRSGWSVSRAGNLNAAVHSNTEVECGGVVVGAPFHDDQAGRVKVFLGSETGLAADPSAIFVNNEPGSQLGYVVSTAGSVDGAMLDGVTLAKVVAGAPNYNSNTGRAYVLEYDIDNQTLAPSQTLTGEQAGARFGFSVAGGADLNADGYDDVIVGAPLHSVVPDQREGAAFAYQGSANGLASTASWTASSGQALSDFGYSVAFAGDTNNDAHADVLVGARKYDGLTTNGGRVYLYLGQSDCNIGGQSYTAGQANPANDCEVCNPDLSRVAWSEAANGTTCDDGDVCTTSNTCQSGVCGGVAVVCNDNNPCTANSCNPVTGCEFEAAPMDGQSCPSDGRNCTDDICQSGVCTHPVSSGCLIGNTCFAEGATNESNDCLVCDPNQSSTSWSTQPSGTSCDNTVYCTVNDTCNANGQCVAGPARECDVPQCYTNSTCSNAQRRCIPSGPQTGTVCSDGNACTVGDQCVSGTCTPGPETACDHLDDQCNAGVCDPNNGACSAVPVSNGTSCDDGDMCTDNSCQNGICATGAPVTCEDDNECTVGSCDPQNGCTFSNVSDGTTCSSDNLACTANQCIGGQCDHPLLAGWCLIDGGCQADGTVNPSNPCQVCNSAQDANAWSGREAGIVCGVPVCTEDAEGLNPEATCDGQGACAAPAPQSCGDYLCEQGACLDACEDDLDCAGEAYCNDVNLCSTENRPPVANAGADQFVNDDDTVTLDGSGSFDPDGDALTFSWVQLSGIEVQLSDPLSSSPQFVAPRANPGESEELLFELTVNDGEFDSPADTTLVTVDNSGNQRPIAVITGAETASVGETVVLSGLNSTDPDGDSIVSYTWSLVSGEPIAAIAQSPVQGEVWVRIPDTLPEDVIYTISLIVSDGAANSDPALHEIEVLVPLIGDDVGGDVGTDVGPDAGDDIGPQPDAGDDIGPQPDAGDDIGPQPDAGDDTGYEPDTGDLSDVGFSDLDESERPLNAGALEGSTCFCGTVETKSTPTPWFLAVFALGAAFVIRRRLVV